MRRRLLLFLALPLLLCATRAQAQTGALVSYELQVFNPGVSPVTGTPVQTNTIPAASVTCNTTKPTVPATVVNPSQAFWDDPTNAGKVCLVNQGTFLASLVVPSPFGPYTATVTVTDDFGLTSARSAASNPFFRRGNPNPRTGVSVN